MTSGEPIYARAIRKQHITMCNYAKQMYNANQLPKESSEYTQGLLRKSNCLFYKHLIFMYLCSIINF